MPQTRQIALTGLSEQEVADYIELASGIAPPPRLARAIHAETEGNPLFIAEVVRLLDAEGRLHDADAPLRIPAGARAVIERLAAAEIARELGSSDLLARAALGCGGRFLWSRGGGDPRLVSLVRDALEAVGPADSPSRAMLLARYATVLRGRLQPEQQDEISREAVEIARRLDGPRALSQALVSRRLTSWDPAKAHDDLGICDEISRLADVAGDWEHGVEARLLRSHARFVLGDIRGVYADLDEAIRWSADRRVPSVHWHIAVHQVELALLEGRFDDAEELMRRTFELGRRAERTDALSSHTTQSYALRRELGGVEEVAPDLVRLVEDRPGRALPRCLLAELDCALGRERRARTALARLVADGCQAIARDIERSLCLATLAGVAAALEEAAASAVLYEQLLPAADLVVIDPHEFSVGAAARPLGVLAATCGRFDDAERHFQRALELNAAIGAHPWLAHAEEAYARMLVARGRPGDAARAEELLTSAIATYRELGMHRPLRQAEALAAAR